MALVNLKIEHLALHVIQQGGKTANAKPVLSEDLTPLDGDNRGFLQTRLSDALKRARPVVEDQELPDGTPLGVKEYLAGSTPLLAVSTRLAEYLQAAQPGVSPGGLLMVASGSLNAAKIVVLAKLEHETGARAKEETTADGKHIYGMEFLKDLFFTKGSRVYKVAVFTELNQPGDLLTGLVADQQSAGNAVAGYFMNEFLGCNFTQKPDVLTEIFYTAASIYFAAVVDPARRAHYQVALLSELTSNKREIIVPNFAKDYLALEDQQSFTDALETKSIALTRPIPKDITLVSSKLARVQMDFSSNVMLLAPPDEFREGGAVTISESSDGESRVTIRDKVKRVSSAGRVRATTTEKSENGSA